MCVSAVLYLPPLFYWMPQPRASTARSRAMSLLITTFKPGFHRAMPFDLQSPTHVPAADQYDAQGIHELLDQLSECDRLLWGFEGFGGWEWGTSYYSRDGLLEGLYWGTYSDSEQASGDL